MHGDKRHFMAQAEQQRGPLVSVEGTSSAAGEVRSQLEADLAATQSQLAFVQAERSEQAVRIEALERQLRGEKGENEQETRALLEGRDNTNQSLTIERDAAHAKAEEVEKKCASLHSELQDLRRQRMEGENAARSDSAESAARSEGELKRLQQERLAERRKSEDELAASQAEVERLEGEAQALKQTHDRFELQLLVAEKEIESLQEDLQRLKQAQHETFNKELEGLRDQLQHAEGRAQGASMERDALQKLVRDIEAKTVRQQREYKGKLQVAQIDVARATRELEAALAARARAEAAPTQLQLEIKTLLAQNEKLEEQENEHVITVRRLENEKQGLMREMAALKDSLQMAEAKNNEDEKSLEQLGQEVLQGRWQAKTSQAQKESDTAEHVSELRALREQRDAALQAKGELEEQAVQAQLNTMALQQHAEELEERLARCVASTISAHVQTDKDGMSGEVITREDLEAAARRAEEAETTVTRLEQEIARQTTMHEADVAKIVEENARAVKLLETKVQIASSASKAECQQLKDQVEKGWSLLEMVENERKCDKDEIQRLRSDLDDVLGAVGELEALISNTEKHSAGLVGMLVGQGALMIDGDAARKTLEEQKASVATQLERAQEGVRDGVHRLERLQYDRMQEQQVSTGSVACTRV